MIYKIGSYSFSDELYHFRTKGSKNGVRLYQNPDGSLTPLGRIHYGIKERRELRKTKKEIKKKQKVLSKSELKKVSDEELRNIVNRLRLENEYRNLTAKKKGLGKKVVEQLADVSVKAIPNLAQSYMKRKEQEAKNEGKRLDLLAEEQRNRRRNGQEQEDEQ